MVKAKTSTISGAQPAPERKPRAISPPPTEQSLALQRFKELDREFARQTKQLTQMAKRLRKKLKDKLTD